MHPIANILKMFCETYNKPYFDYNQDICLCFVESDNQFISNKNRFIIRQPPITYWSFQYYLKYELNISGKAWLTIDKRIKPMSY